MSATTPRTRKLIADGDHAMVRDLRLQVVAGQDRGLSFRPTNDKVVIGTHPSCDFVLSDPTVSRFHFEMSLCGERVTIRDLDSRNGTFIGGIYVTEATLSAETTIRVGESLLRFDPAGLDLRVALSKRRRFGHMVGESAAMRACFAILERAASSDITVVLGGETGVGKDLAAEALHSEGHRAGGPFVVVDCGAMPARLIEDDLFGHERGAFTGAHGQRIGALESARGGTVFLDEVGELAPELQPVLLRAIESRHIRRVGGNQSIPIDVRFVAATNRDLRAEVNARRFRADLYFRLAVVAVDIPPLRDRPEDIGLLVAQIADELGVDPMVREQLELSDTLATLRNHTWPGNVRELRNHIERWAMAGRRIPVDATPANQPPSIDPSIPLRPARDQWIRWFEQRYLERLLDQHGGNVTAAARSAGVGRIHLHRLLAKVGLR